MAVRNKGVTQSVVPQANAMIDAEVSGNSRRSMNAAAATTYGAETKVDALNNNTMVFYNSKHEMENAKERSVQGNGNRARRVAVFQNYDGRDKNEIDEYVGFAGVTVSNANGRGINVEQHSTAVVVNGTNSAQNPEQAVIPIFSRLRWDVRDDPRGTNDKQTTIRGMKPQRLFSVKEESDNRAQRIRDCITQGVIHYTVGRQSYFSTKTNLLISKLNAAVLGLGTGGNNYVTDNNYRTNVDQLLLELSQAFLTFVEYDERHRIGFSLGTPSNNKGQIDMHISRV